MTISAAVYIVSRCSEEQEHWQGWTLFSEDRWGTSCEAACPLSFKTATALIASLVRDPENSEHTYSAQKVAV